MVASRRWLVLVLLSGAVIVGACVGDAPATDSGDAGNDTNDATTGGDASSRDSASNSDAASGPCDLTKPFGAPVAVAGLPVVNSVVRFSQDELTAYFAMQVDDGGPFSLNQATRDDITKAFGTPVPLDALNDDAGESDPAVSVDGRDIIYVHTYGRSTGSTLRDIWHGSRATLDASFTNPTKIAGEVNLDGIQDDYASLAASDDLWFVSTRVDGGTHEIFHALTAGGISYSSVVLAPNINAPGTDQYYPVVASSGLRIYYLRNQTLYAATRAKTSDDFSNAAAVTELNAALPGLRPSWVSPDDCRIYVTAGNPQLAYVASKPQN